MTATNEPQEGLLQLWESIPEQLRLGESYTFDALSQSIASLVEKAQKDSRFVHKDELADALGGIQTANDSLQELLVLARQHAWQSSERGFGRDMPAPFTGAASDYQRWKSQIKNSAIVNEAAPGNAVAAAVLGNTSGRAKRWAQSKEPRQYSVIDGAPASAAATVDAIFKDMDKVFIDAGARGRAHDKFLNARQGTRPVFEYNIYYLNIILELGRNPESGDWTWDYIESLRDCLQQPVREWQYKILMRDEEATLNECMRVAAAIEPNYPAPKKRRQKKN